MSSPLTSTYLQNALDVHKAWTKGVRVADMMEIVLEEYESDIPLYVAEIRTLRRKLSALKKKGATHEA